MVQLWEWVWCGDLSVQIWTYMDYHRLIVAITVIITMGIPSTKIEPQNLDTNG